MKEVQLGTILYLGDWLHRTIQTRLVIPDRQTQASHDLGGSGIVI